MHLHISYASDNNYAQYMGISIISLLENNKNFENITLHILENNINDDIKNNIKNIVSAYNREIIFYDLTKLLQKLNSEFQIPATISMTAYCRLFISTILNNSIDKILYVDCDSIFNSDLIELWKINFEENVIAAVEDHVNISSKTSIGIPPNAKYVNSGFLFINLKELRAMNAELKMIDVVKEYNGNVNHHDQGIINKVFYGKIHHLHPKYNVLSSFYDFKSSVDIAGFYNSENYYSQKQIDEAKQNPVFIHFTPSFSKRPWVEGCRHPLKEKFLYYKSISPWKDEPLLKDNRKFKLKFLDIIFNTIGPKGYKMIFN